MPTRVERCRGRLALALVSIATSLGGCGSDGDRAAIAPQPSPDVYRSPLKADPGRTGDFNRSGLLARRVPTTARAATAPARVAVPAVPTPLVASTRPIPAGDTLPEYLILGSVVANVNGSPIYANELLQVVAPLLRARARDLDATKFRALASDELKKQRQQLIEDELVYAAAQRNTTPDEAKEAQQRTFLLRERLISEAGGSLEMARQLAREQGTDFDTMLAKQERQTLVALYYRKRIFPQVTMTVDEMRRYYEQNEDRLFTTPATATIHVIRVGIDESGGDANVAAQRAADAKRRIDAGENL